MHLLTDLASVAGVDEAGRGCLAGPVYAAAVILDPSNPISGLKDSKKLSAKQRIALCEPIQQKALAWCIGTASVEEIDTHNILQASLLAMSRAVCGLNLPPTLALIDGNQLPSGLPCQATYIIKGDTRVPSISAASILAKVLRDAYMCTLNKQYPGYGFSQHKGYGTYQHRKAITRLGLSPCHRQSFSYSLAGKE